MAKFCGGIKLDNTFKVIKGIICDANATTLLSGLGDSYTLTVSKTGFTTKTQAVVNNGDQTVEVTLEVAGG